MQRAGNYQFFLVVARGIQVPVGGNSVRDAISGLRRPMDRVTMDLVLFKGRNGVSRQLGRLSKYLTLLVWVMRRWTMMQVASYRDR